MPPLFHLVNIYFGINRFIRINSAKFMLTSEKIADENANLLFTILDRAELSSVVSSILATFPDLLVRHPNVIEPWTKFVFRKLSDDSVEIKRNCLRMVSPPFYIIYI